MRTLIRVALAAAGMGAAVALASPAANASRSGYAHLGNLAMTKCLYAPRQGGVVQVVPCRWASQGQMWYPHLLAAQQPFVATLSRLCLTAASRSVVTAAKCTSGRGQEWYRPPFVLPFAISSARFPHLCLTTPRGGRAGPVRLAGCGRAPGQFWGFRAR